MNVLLLEDDRQIQRSTLRLIQYAYEHAEVSIVETCAQAIALLSQRPFDLVVADFRVLDGTGDAVLCWVRQMQPQLLSRFVFFSGSEEVYALHDKIIDKGCTADEFIDRLHKFIGAPS